MADQNLQSAAVSPVPPQTKAEVKAEVAAAVEAKPHDAVSDATHVKAANAASSVDKKPNSAAERKKLLEAEKLFRNGVASIRDLIAPSSFEISFEHLGVDGMYSQTFFVYTYPRYIDTNWLSAVVNYDVTMDVSQFIYPIASEQIMKTIRTKVAQLQSSIRMSSEKGNVRDPVLETALEDAEVLRTELQRGQERFFQFGLYFTIYAEDLDELKRASKELQSLLAGKLVLTKRADLQMERGFNSTIPLCLDELGTNRNMNTSPLSTTFPFISSELTSNDGILYGLNRHNDGLIIFDRFSLENANSVVFAKSGAGKSYAVKLEILRSLMFGTDVIVIDPENEYKPLCETVGGTYLDVSLNSDRRINPFDLPTPLEGEEVKPGDLLRSSVISLTGLMRLMLGEMTAQEEGVLDKALIDTYATKGITMSVADPSQYKVPTMEDFYSVLSSMEGAENMTQRVAKFVTGTYSGIFNQETNVALNEGLVVFSVRDLEDELRPVAMYIILNYIWGRVRSTLKKRLLVVDEAWSLMQHEDSAKFLFGLVKRSRKYYLGVTTITQDVEDFVRSPYGKPIITNSSMQLLLKQSPTAIDALQTTFNLTEGEKYLLLNSGVGQGLFFAGLKHVAIQVIASYGEDKIVTTNPEELLAQTAADAEYESAKEGDLPVKAEPLPAAEVQAEVAQKQNVAAVLDEPHEAQAAPVEPVAAPVAEPAPVVEAAPEVPAQEPPEPAPTQDVPVIYDA
jgi:conjugal transfer ATP-binding protein TraC